MSLCGSWKGKWIQQLLERNKIMKPNNARVQTSAEKNNYKAALEVNFCLSGIAASFSLLVMTSLWWKFLFFWTQSRYLWSWSELLSIWNLYFLWVFYFSVSLTWLLESLIIIISAINSLVTRVSYLFLSSDSLFFHDETLLLVFFVII